VPEGQPDAELAGDFEGAAAGVSELLDDAGLTQALERIWTLVRRLNRYVEEARPWDLAKEESGDDRLDQVLYNLAEGLRVTTLLLLPYMPETCERLLAALGEEGRGLRELGSLGGGQRIEKLSPLFPKLVTG
jgi:methionyl-tRNA synthetase